MSSDPSVYPQTGKPPAAEPATTDGRPRAHDTIGAAQLRQHAAIKRRVWLAAIWSWPVCVVVFGAAFVFLAGFVPPPSPAFSASQIADVYAAHRTGIKVGVLIGMFASALLLPFLTVVSAEIKKIEGRLGLLAPIQFGGGIALVMIFQIIGLAWLTATYRPDAAPDVTRALNDYTWFAWSSFIATYSLQFICMAIAGFMDIRPHPAWPRWAAYLNLWVAVTGAGGVLAVFFKTGPFAWNGVVGYWIPVVLFVIGLSTTTWLLHRRTRYEATHPSVHPTEPELGDLALL
jgi:hypothetical protein